MRLKKKTIRLIAFLMTFFMFTSELSVMSYASTVNGDYSINETDESLVDTAEVTEDDIDAIEISEDENSNSEADEILEENSEISEDETVADEDSTDKTVDDENAEETVEEDTVTEESANEDEITEEDATTEEVDAEEEVSEEISDENIETADAEVIEVLVSENSSANANVLYAVADKFDAEESFADMSLEEKNFAKIFYEKVDSDVEIEEETVVESDEEAAIEEENVFEEENTTEEETSIPYIYIKVKADDAYELAVNAEANYYGFTVNEGNVEVAKTEEFEDIYKVNITDLKDVTVCAETNAVIYNAEFNLVESEAEETEDETKTETPVIEAVFATELVVGEETTDIAPEFAGASIEKALYIKLPAVVDEKAVAYNEMHVVIGETDKEITEAVYANEEYIIYQIAEAGEINNNIIVSSKIGEAEVYDELSAEVSDDALEASVKLPVTINYNSSYGKISARIDAQMLAPTEEYTNSLVFDVPSGKTLTIIVTPNKWYSVSGAYIQQSSKLTAPKSNTFTIKPTANYINDVDIVFKPVIKGLIFDENNEMEDVNGVFKLSFAGYYSFGVVKGSDTLLPITSYDLTVDKTKLNKYTSTRNGVLYFDFREFDTKLIAGKTLNLTVKADDNGSAVTKKYKLAVDAPATSVTVAGAKWVSGYNEISVPVGIEKKFKVTTNNNGKVDLSKVTVKPITSQAGVSVRFDQASSSIIVKADPYKTLGDMTFEFYYKGSRIENSKNSFKIKPEVKSLTKLEPVVKVDSTTDTNINLRLGFPKSYDSTSDSLYYVVEATAVVSSKAPLADGMEEYVSYTIKPSQLKEGIASIKVAKSSVLAGSGAAQKYKVNVYVAQSKSASGLSQLTVNNIEAKSKKVSVSTATQNPYYDMKISVKKIKSSIKQGEQDLLMAQLTNSAKTTFRGGFELLSVQAQYKKFGYYDTEDVSVDETALYNGKLVVSADSDAYADKNMSYRVTFKAINAPETRETVASFTFKVTGGIDYIEVVNPSEKLYKAYNKAASMKLSVKAYDSNEKAIKVTTKNVKYEIVDFNGNGISSSSMNANIRDAVEKKLIKVSGGKVTVDKKYIVTANEFDNQFRVKIYANDYPNNNYYTYSDVITLTGVAQKIAELRWVVAPVDNVISTEKDSRNSKKTFKLYIDNTYHIDDFVVGYFVALDSDGNIVNDVTFKSSQKFNIFQTKYDKYGNKYLYMRSRQYATASYTIKAVANNGTGSFKSKSFKTTAEKAISYGYESVGGYVTETSSTSGNVTYLTNTTFSPFYVVIQSVNGGSLRGGVSVSGGKLISTKKSGNTKKYLIVPNSQYTYVYCTEKISNGWWTYSRTAWTYNVTNTSWSGYNTVESAADANTTNYVSSTIVSPENGTFYTGYQDTYQSLKYNISGSYSYSSGDKVSFYMDPTADGAKKTSSRKPLNEFLFGTTSYFGYSLDYNIASDKSFTISSALNKLSTSTKSGSYTYYGIIKDSSGKIKSQPFKIVIKVKPTAKRAGDIKSTSSVRRTANAEVRFAYDKSQINVKDLTMTSTKNANINGLPSDFNKFFKVSGGKLVVRSDAPVVTKATAVTGWVYYDLITPTGKVSSSKKVTITVKP